MPAEPADGPTTFEEYLGEASRAGSVLGCRRCGQPATHVLDLAARQRRGAAGRRAGPSKAIAKKKSDLCERCAVQLFAKVSEVMR